MLYLFLKSILSRYIKKVIVGKSCKIFIFLFKFLNKQIIAE